MKRDFEVDDGDLLKALLSGDKNLFFSSIEAFDAYNILFAIINNTSPSILLDKISEEKWDDVVDLRNLYISHFSRELKDALDINEYFVGLRMILENSPILTLYASSPERNLAFALINFEGKVSCARVFDFADYSSYHNFLEDHNFTIDKNQFLTIKRNMSSFYSSKIYKGVKVQNIGEVI